MKTIEQKFTAREWLTRFLPEGGEWRIGEGCEIVWHASSNTGGTRFSRNGLHDGNVVSIREGYYQDFHMSSRSAAIDLMVQAWEQQAGDATEASDPYANATTLQLYHDEQEFNGFINAKPFDDGWIDEFVKTFVPDLPDVRQMAAMNLTIITAKIVKNAQTKGLT